MANIWERFNGIASVDEVKEAKEQFAPIPAGTYEVVLDKIEAGESKTGLPMIKGQFTIIEGGRKIFYNHLLQNVNKPEYTARAVSEGVTFIEKLLDDTINFKGLAQLAEKIDTVPAGGKYRLKVAYGQKDTELKFPKLTVVNIIREMDADEFEAFEDETIF